MPPVCARFKARAHLWALWAFSWELSECWWFPITCSPRMNPKCSPYPLEPKASYFCAAVKTRLQLQQFQKLLCNIETKLRSKSFFAKLLTQMRAPVPAHTALTLAVTAKNPGTTMRCCTASAFQSLSPDSLETEGLCLCFSFPACVGTAGRGPTRSWFKWISLEQCV